MSPTAIIVSDLHLNASERPKTGAAVARLLERHPGAELVLNGDIFELSRFPTSASPARALQQTLAANPEFRRALQVHQARGSAVTFVAGNHDAALVELEAMLRAELGTAERSPEVARWFIRRGRVHIEHGHVYDPDNAPLHPLADFTMESEPLGSALMRRFIAHAGADAFAHAHETTPIQGIRRAFSVYGARAPGLIARYFRTAFELCWEAATVRSSQRRTAEAEGQQRLSELATEASEDRLLAQRLFEFVAAPTHARFGSTFARLYFDAIVAGGAGTVAFTRFALAGSPPALGALALASGYLALARPKARYRGRPCQELRLAAEQVAQATGAVRVVFGHTHVEEDRGPYFNLGSFTYARGLRSYALVLPGDRVERGHLPE